MEICWMRNAQKDAIAAQRTERALREVDGFGQDSLLSEKREWGRSDYLRRGEMDRPVNTTRDF